MYKLGTESFAAQGLIFCKGRGCSRVDEIPANTGGTGKLPSFSRSDRLRQKLPRFRRGSSLYGPTRKIRKPLGWTRPAAEEVSDC
jgi:hypothetical protein